jgi:hypothetical protein
MPRSNRSLNLICPLVAIAVASILFAPCDRRLKHGLSSNHFRPAANSLGQKIEPQATAYMSDDSREAEHDATQAAAQPVYDELRIRSIHVPTFKSGSNRRSIEYQLTDAVQKQIQQRTPFRLEKDEDADTRLTGRIIDLRKSALGINQHSDARELQVNLMVEVTWEDLRTGKILAVQRAPLPPEMRQLAAQAEFAPEVGQSLAAADQTAIDRLARNIVDMMETAW